MMSLLQGGEDSKRFYSMSYVMSSVFCCNGSWRSHFCTMMPIEKNTLCQRVYLVKHMKSRSVKAKQFTLLTALTVTVMSSTFRQHQFGFMIAQVLETFSWSSSNSLRPA